jgi:hypothetical protein
MAAGASAPFVWGSGGRKMTPEQIARQREIAEAMIAQAGDTSPVQHWTQGAARVAQALAGVVKERRANSAEQSANQSGMAALAAALGGSGSGMAADMPATGAQPSAASPDFSSVQPAEGFQADPRIRDGIASTATALGIDPVDLATAISYETAGTFDPTKRGPTTQWGQHRGLIQFGEPQARENGVNWDDPIGSQLGENGAVANYLRRSGVQPGMGLLDIYSAINAGAPGLYNRSDANNGGAPGTVRDKVEQQMAGHRAKAMALFPDMANAPGGGAVTMAGQMPGDGFQIPGAQGASFDERFATDPSMNTFRSGGMQGMTAGNIPGMGEFGLEGAQPTNMSQVQGGPLEMGRVIPEGQAFEPMPPDAPGGIVEQALARQGGAPPMDISPPQAAYASQGASQGAPMAPQQPMIDPNQYAGGEWIPPDVGRVLAAQQMGQAPAPQDTQSAMVQQGSASPAPAQGGIGGIVQSLLGGGGGPAEMASLGGTPEMQSVVQALGGANGLAMLAADPSTPASIRQVAMALYGQEQGKAEKAQAIDAQRQQLQAAGIDPAYAGIDPLVSAAAGAKYRAPPTSIAEFEYGQTNPGFNEAQLERERAGAQNISVGGQSDTFRDESDKAAAKAYAEMMNTGITARSKLAQIDRMEALLSSAPQGATGALTQIAGNFGINIDGLSEVQAATALINQLVPQQRQPGSGPMSDADLALFKQSLPRIINQPDGNRIIMNTMRGIAEYEMQQGDIARLVIDGEMTPAQGREGLMALENPLAFLNDVDADTGGSATPSSEDIDAELRRRGVL